MKENIKKYTKWLVFTICLVLFILIALNVHKGINFKIDDIIYKYISKLSFLDNFFKITTNLGSSTCIILITILFIFIFKHNKIKLLLTSNLIFVTVLSQIFKRIFKRLRPLDPLIIEKGFSFPSGHSMVSMAFYGYLIYLIYLKIDNKYLKYSLILILSLVILTIGISRIYLRVHFPSDVMGGFFFSISYLILSISMSQKYLKQN